MTGKPGSASPADDTKVDDVALNSETGATSEDRNDTSSTSKDVAAEEGAKTGIDIVRDVLKLDANNQPVTEASSPSPSDKKDKVDETTDDDKSKDKTDDTKSTDVLEQAAKSTFREDPVFKKVTGALKETRGKLEAATAQIEAVKPRLQFAEGMADFMSKTGVTPEALSETMQIAALIVSNPTEARKRLKETLDELDEALGEKLPADLQKKVNDGDLDWEEALRISRAEAKARLAETRTAETAKTTDEKTKQENAEKARKAVATAVEARFSVLASSDPDFKKKEEQMAREIALLLTKQKPSNVNEAIKLVNDAYENTNKFFKDLVPVSRDRKPNAGGGEPSTKQKLAELPAKTSGLDVTKAALGLL